ncbi:hypothetical protein BV25DRAFT_1888666 [Artomyces pyxidatus]|uniref:Uncharacterized protein n=2 Tax=Artomyces pyxidatus TaxID=48021 RepID=A0ACB8SDP0_9AGAM|nr:hypothetical protein BV25DRAFT_1895656 [Artomyces pyxidatus]KAI0060306.1 hypothetical protein BV25DRAFT_1888666 [Artomyces pyxidatus]
MTGCGISGNALMSRRTVGRAIKEGGIASNIQMGYEIKNSDGFTYSVDGTSHRDLQYESRHIAVVAPSSYLAGEQSAPTHQVRLISVTTTVNHTSETQLEGIKESLEAVRKAFADSPLAKRNAITLEAEEIMRKWSGLNTDHAADQQKLYRLACLWKAECMEVELGQVSLIERPTDELIGILLETNRKKISDAGGPDAWKALSPEEKTVCEVAIMRQLAVRLGKEAYGDLPEEKKRELDLFIWCGCSMHKELNSVKGGNRAMQEFWILSGITPPILLANRDNAATLDGIADGATPSTAAEIRAAEVSSRGGVKTTELAGALFNHKDDKKGAHDTYRNYLREHYGRKTNFPDTSNTRYQTYCDGAGEIIVFKEGLLELLNLIKDKKTTRTLNHMEQNVYNALQDAPTLTEMSVLVLYAQAVTHPYMRFIRGSGSGNGNMLNYGPFHRDVLSFIQKLIDNPSLLLAANATSETGSMDGLDWFRPEAFEAVQKLAPDLPHLEGALVAFLRGALATWERFTSEFAPGGLIDQATASERERAWMPATNDANEGALGSFRLHARMKPSSTVHAYNAQATYSHNNTEDFMAALFIEPADHRHLMREARAMDSSGLAAKARALQVAHDQAVVDEKRAKDVMRKHKVNEKEARLQAIVLITDVASLEKLTSAQLEDQMDKWRKGGDTLIGLKKDSLRKAEKLSKLHEAISRSASLIDSDPDLMDVDRL